MTLNQKSSDQPQSAAANRPTPASGGTAGAPVSAANTASDTSAAASLTSSAAPTITADAADASRSPVRTMTRTALMTAVLIVCSQIAFPLPGGIPVTLQTFAIALLGGLLGTGKGAAAVAVYLAMGAAGLPVFAGFKGGLDVLTGPTGGFLIGFLPMAALIGQNRGRLSRILLPAAGLVSCHGIGLLWLSTLTDMPLPQAFAVACLPFLLKDILSVAAALTVAEAIRRRLGSRI